MATGESLAHLKLPHVSGQGPVREADAEGVDWVPGERRNEA